MRIPYNRSNWYWVVAGDTEQVYSSAAGDYVDVDDATYTAWLATGAIPTPISANDMLLMRIDILEASITERMKQEAMARSTNTFSSGPYAGKTALEAIEAIVDAKDALRAELV